MSSSSASTRSPSKSGLSPELSERLKPDHRHNRDHHDFHRRRHQRRPNKRGRRQWHHNSSRPRSPIESNPRASRPRSPRSRSPEQPQNSKVEKRSPVKNASSSSGSKDNLHRRGIKKNLVLRPTKGPLLNAPKNSTQFIIDDHEPFLDTEVSPKKYNTRSRSVSSSSASRRISASEEAFCSPSGSPEKTAAAVTSSTTAASSANANAAVNGSSKEEKDCQATPGNYVVGDDDYTYWAEYSDRDFQSVYESAHQEEVADWDRQRLIDEISNLEKRQKELVSVLAKVDPELYAQQLESQLATLQEKNRLLKDNAPQAAAAQALSHDDESSMDSTAEPTSKSAPQESPDSSTK